jgi:hypothetical protein
MFRKVFLSGLLTLLMVMISCSKPESPVAVGDNLPYLMDRSPYPESSVEAIANWPDTTCPVAKPGEYFRWREILDSLRVSFPGLSDTNYCLQVEGRWVNAAAIGFQYPTYLGQLILYFDNDSIGQSVLDTTYHAWDSLNGYFRLDSMEARAYKTLIAVTMFFHPRLDAKYLAKAYQGLPGLKALDYGGSLHIGDGSQMYVGYDQGQEVMISRVAWGDCPSGCLNSKFFFFRVVQEKRGDWHIELVGSYQLNLGLPEPEWMALARTLFLEWWRYYDSRLGGPFEKIDSDACNQMQRVYRKIMTELR